MTPGTDAQRPSGQGVIAIPIVDGHRGGVRPGRWPSAEELSALGHVLVPRPIREQAVIPHAEEAAREHMQEDAPDELRRGQGHGLLTRCVGTAGVGVAEPDLPRVEGEEPLVGDGDPMRVPTDVIEHLVGPGEGWLGVDHPVGLPGGLEMVLRPRVFLDTCLRESSRRRSVEMRKHVEESVATGAAAGRGRGGRFSAGRKREVVMRLLRGEDLESVSRAVGITAARASHWRAQFLAAGQAGLKSRATDARDDDHRRLQAKIGELLMETELLYAKVDQLEASGPLARRRSTR